MRTEFLYLEHSDCECSAGPSAVTRAFQFQSPNVRICGFIASQRKVCQLCLLDKIGSGRCVCVCVCVVWSVVLGCVGVGCVVVGVVFWRCRCIVLRTYVRSVVGVWFVGGVSGYVWCGRVWWAVVGSDN